LSFNLYFYHKTTVLSTNKLSLIVLQENKHWLVIYKPSGLIVERNPFESPTVEELVYDHLAQTSKRPYVGVVHRLDRVTSGLMIFAKKKSILRKLNEQFAQQAVHKTYLAITERCPEPSEGTLKHWLYKNQKEKRADIFPQAGKDRKEVSLQYKVLQQLDGRALLEIQPLTGKFHQIRAQLGAIGCPVLGDGKYGGQESYPPLCAALHAWKLQLQDPLSGALLSFKAPLPDHEAWNAFDSP
jgi:23S rRNA pseudouridine1911/1915/1917 synthase